MLECYNRLIHQSRHLKKPKTEKTVFSIGGRGHYENPITDLLAFFCNPREEHQFGELFLLSLFELIDPTMNIFRLDQPPIREQTTYNGNRIDLLLEGDDWVLALENKINHSAINPFDDYKDYIIDEYKDKKLYFVLLSVKRENPPGPWKNILYADFVYFLKKNYGKYLATANNNKWHVFFRDFILNLKEQTGIVTINSERLAFVKKNYTEINEIKQMHDEFIGNIISEGKKAIEEVSNITDISINSNVEDWGDGKLALRLYPSWWTKKSNICIGLSDNGELSLQLYVYDISDEEEDTLVTIINGEENYDDYWTEAKTIRCFNVKTQTGYYIENLEQLCAEIKEAAKRVNTFFHQR